MASEKTFYLETFGCQMNAHDSEKVIGTLLHEGYRQVETEEDAGLILYNTCSIRDKAEQKVFNRLNDYKKLHKAGKRFGVLGCVAQQEGEKIFERAPYVSLVSGSASYRKLPEMLGRLEAGENRITGLDDRQTDETFETEFTARQNPYRGYITIIEGCDKFCAYCVVPYTRGKERSRGSVFRPRGSAPHRRPGIHRDPAPGPERQQLPRSGREVELRRTARGRRPGARASGAFGSPPATRATSPATSSRPSTPIQPSATTCTCRFSPAHRACSKMMAREYTPRLVPGAHQLDQGSEAADLAFDGHHRRLSWRDRRTISSRRWTLLAGGPVRLRLRFQVLRRGPTRRRLTMIDSIPETEKAKRLQVVLDRQREIQRINYAKHLGEVMEVMVEGTNPARGQISGRSSQNKPVNFT